MNRTLIALACLTGLVHLVCPARVLAEDPASAPPLLLGPYAQYLSPDAVKIHWQTKSPGPTRVKFGFDKELGRESGDGKERTKHEVVLSGITGQRLFYAVFASQGGARFWGRTHELDPAFNYSVPSLSGASPYSAEANRQQHAREILAAADVKAGYCLVVGVSDGALAFEIARQSRLVVHCVDTDAERVAALRKRFAKAGAYGSRITVRTVGDLSKLPFTKFFANLVISESPDFAPSAEVDRLLAPGRGKTVFKRGKAWSVKQRPALDDAGVWSHQYGSPDNSSNSRDDLEGASMAGDLVVQWLGRPGADAMSDRNPRKPSPLSIAGRLFTQGHRRIIAQDAYNGAILWSLEVPDFLRVNMPRDSSNWCADEKHLYVAIGDRLWQLDAATGILLDAFPVGGADEGNGGAGFDWSYIAIASDDNLIGSGVRQGASFRNIFGGSNEGWADAKGGPSTFKVCSDFVFGLSPTSGEKRWSYRGGKIINPTLTYGGGRLYFVECRHPKVEELETGRIGIAELWKEQYLVALDPNTGEKIWEQPIDTPDGVVVFYLQYSDEKLVVAASNDRYHVDAFDAKTGKAAWSKSHVWRQSHHGGHMQHPAIVNGVVYLRPNGYRLSDGHVVTSKMPDGGCGTISATRNSLLFRASTIHMWDFRKEKDSEWSSLRPGCWVSTIAAGGMVLAPEAGGGCSCGYWLQTSVGFAKREESR